jgi:hypothetical protein
MENTMKTMKLGLGTVASALLFAALGVAPARAQNPPPGWIFQLAGPGQGVLSNYQQYTASFTADSNATYVSFAFREVPDFFAFDDASVVDLANPSVNLLNDPGFTNAQVGQTIPTGWGRWIQPIDTSFIGLVSNGPGSSCAPNQGGPVSGGNFWCDGSVQGYDALWQEISTTPGDHYQITFYLGDNSGEVPINPTIDMFAYAGDSLPGGTDDLPEPSSLALFGTGVLGVAGIVRRKMSP